MNDDQQIRFTYHDKIHVFIGAGSAHGEVSQRIDTPEIRPYYDKLRWLWTASVCPYCGDDLCNPLKRWDRPYPGRYPYDLTLRECSSCSWWALDYQLMMYGDDYGSWDYYEAVLRTFDLASRTVALATLREYLQRKYDDIRHIHPRKFEELCASVFREHFNCQVAHTAASRDGGIDLYAVTIENDIFAIQCKRRKYPSTESVEQVRAFLGALIVANVPRGVFVTTADHFSREALSLAQGPPLKNFGIELQLLDYRKFREIFELTVPDPQRAWLGLLPREARESKG